MEREELEVVVLLQPLLHAMVEREDPVTALFLERVRLEVRVERQVLMVQRVRRVVVMVEEVEEVEVIARMQQVELVELVECLEVEEVEEELEIPRQVELVERVAVVKFVCGL